MIRLAYDSDTLDCDFVVDPDTGTDESRPLETAVLLSIHCDALARLGDDIPENSSRRGWWAVAYFDEPDRWGSDVWQGLTGKATEGILQFIQRAVLESLQWMIDDGVAGNVEAETWWIDGRIGYMGILVRVYKPNDPTPALNQSWKVYYALD